MGQGLGHMGEEKGVIIDVKGQWQAAGHECTGEEVQMSQQCLANIKPGQGQEPAVVINDLQEGKKLVATGEPAMRGSVVLPELADLLDLPAAHRLSRGFGVGWMSQSMNQRPAADGGTVQLKPETPVDLRCGKTVGDRRSCSQKFAQQLGDLRAPRTPTIAA